MTGTAFGVSEEEGITTVNVVGGRVAVVSGGGSAQVERGQSAGAAADRPPAMIPDKPYAELSWARDVIEFKQQPLQDVLDWLSENSGYTFYSAPDIASICASISIRGESVEEVLDTLAFACGFGYTIDGRDYTIRKQGE